jgi:hypothetical protein
VGVVLVVQRSKVVGRRGGRREGRREEKRCPGIIRRRNLHEKKQNKRKSRQEEEEEKEEEQEQEQEGKEGAGRIFIGTETTVWGE